MEKNKEIKIQVTEKEYAKIKDKALAKGLSVRAYSKNAVLQRRDRRPNTDILLSIDAIYEALKEFTAVLSVVDKQLWRLLDHPQNDDLSLYAITLEDVDLDFRRLARDVTELTKTVSGEINGNS